MTVNHDVTGSSPVGGAKKKTCVLQVFLLYCYIYTAVFQNLILFCNTDIVISKIWIFMVLGSI